jgi:phosphoglycolate phosphatase
MIGSMVTGVEWKGKRIPCRLIIFDKDGTLVDFATTWVPLIRKRVELLSKALGRDGEMEALLLKSWGIDPENGKIDPRGPCPVSPRSEEIIIGTSVLYQQGYPWDESKQRVIQAFDEADATTDRAKMVKPVAGVRFLLRRLKREGFLLALATNDERVDTDATLAFLGIGHLFDVVVCAGEVNPPKPHPETVLAICRRLSVLPQEAVFVGDAVGDMIAGKRAGLAFTFGVLEGGITPREELAKVADTVIESLRDLVSFSGPKTGVTRDEKY